MALGRSTDYIENPDKTDGGEWVSSYECDPVSVDAEFLYAKRQYAALTGRDQGERDVIAYHLRQSFKPGETDLATANKIGYDLALSLTEDEVMPDIRATIARLAQDGMRVALMGFCWGGGLAVRAAQVTDAAAAVGFYGTGLERYLQDDLHAPVLMHFGTEDDHTPPDIRAAFAARFPEAEIHLYPTGHAFANDARASFQPEAARLAHQRSLDFLSRALAQPV